MPFCCNTEESSKTINALMRFDSDLFAISDAIMHNYNWWVASTANTWEPTRRKSRKSKNWHWRDPPQCHNTVFPLSNTSRNMCCHSSSRPWRQLLSTDPKTRSNSSATTCSHNATNDQIAYPPAIHNHANKESINTQSAISTPPESRCPSSEATL